jgi:hypothetical protein
MQLSGNKASVRTAGHLPTGAQQQPQQQAEVQQQPHPAAAKLLLNLL